VAAVSRSLSVSLVLHSLRLRSPATAEQVADRFDLDRDDVRDALASAEATGWAQHRDGRFGGWVLTTSGRHHGERLLSEELAAASVSADVTDAYRRFRGLNPELLAVCSAWQVIDVDGVLVPNPHDDSGRDAEVMDRLASLHGRVEIVTAMLSRSLERFGGYGHRLDSAFDRVMTGDTDWLTRPGIDSYHTVWFELHEDLLATLGRNRADERHEEEAAMASHEPA